MTGPFDGNESELNDLDRVTGRRLQALTLGDSQLCPVRRSDGQVMTDSGSGIDQWPSTTIASSPLSVQSS